MPPPPNGERPPAVKRAGASQTLKLTADNTPKPGSLVRQASQLTPEQRFAWMTEARRLARAFADTGEWRHFRALLAHVIGWQQRMTGDLA
jgi:hypothetical protein